MPLRPWSPIPIHDCGEPLLPIAGALWRLEPHPYLAQGAPYGPDGNPFLLRSGVVDRLLQAQHALQLEHPDLRLAIFDGWRPLAVQRFMVRHALVAECRRLGVDPDADSPERALVAAEVGRFWAPPSGDPATPPPIALERRWTSPWPMAAERPCPWVAPSMQSGPYRSRPSMPRLPG